ncbi:MAG: hypothetical protein P8N28_05170 [Phycisphaerales bacterium]|nr:hypothetical protein [Phycisphaerales bacterium]
MRRWVGLGIILLFAAGISWWSAKEESKVSIHVQQEVVRLVPLFQLDPSCLSSIVENAVLEPTLANSLEMVYEKSIALGEGVAVVVTSGDNEEYGDGTATHVAVFKVNKEELASLRIICHSDTDPLLITGAWIQ